MNKNIKDLLGLIEKLFEGSISRQERDKLYWFFLINQKINSWPEDFSKAEEIEQRIFNKIKNSITTTEEKFAVVIPFYKKRMFQYAAAASLLLFATVPFLLKENSNSDKSSPKTVVENAAIPAGTDKATLTLEDGTIVDLEKNKNYTSDNAVSNGTDIVYKSSNHSANKVSYNTLTIPRGGQYHLILQDSTVVWLNSESQIRFPVAFQNGSSRKVELIYGEAYFNVSPSTKHKGAHFEVYHDKQEVEVMGTEFNIKAYPNENNIYTTLVEGKVAVRFEGKNKNLIPNQQSKLNLTDKSFKISNVDVSQSIAWKEGLFYFEDEPIENILRTMSRWYDFEYKFKNESLKKERFTGLIKKRKNLQDILNIISRTSNIKYSINPKNNVNEVTITSK